MSSPCSRRVGALALIVVVGSGFSACGDDTTGTTTTTRVVVPTTQVILDTGTYEGTLDGADGTISFEVGTTDDSTGETVADGQIEITWFQVEDFTVTLDGNPCGDEWTAPGPHRVNTISFSAETPGMSVTGQIDRSGASGTVILRSETGVECDVGPLTWTAGLE